MKVLILLAFTFLAGCSNINSSQPVKGYYDYQEEIMVVSDSLK